MQKVFCGVLYFGVSVKEEGRRRALMVMFLVMFVRRSARHDLAFAQKIRGGAEPQLLLLCPSPQVASTITTHD
jgi:hypothetical protein